MVKVMLDEDAFKELVGEEDDIDIGEAIHAWLIMDEFVKLHGDMPEGRISNPISRWFTWRKVERWHKKLKMFESGWRTSIDVMKRLNAGV